MKKILCLAGLFGFITDASAQPWPTTGNVGIGTASPSYKLTLQSSAVSTFPLSFWQVMEVILLVLVRIQMVRVIFKYFNKPICDWVHNGRIAFSKGTLALATHLKKRRDVILPLIEAISEHRNIGFFLPRSK